MDKNLIDRAIAAENTLIETLTGAPYMVERSSLKNMVIGLSLFIQRNRVIYTDQVATWNWVYATLNDIHRLSSRLHEIATGSPAKTVEIESIADGLESLAINAKGNLASSVALLKSMPKPTGGSSAMAANIIGFALVPSMFLTTVAPVKVAMIAALAGAVVGFLVSLRGSSRSKRRINDRVQSWFESPSRTTNRPDDESNTFDPMNSTIPGTVEHLIDTDMDRYR